jgi:peptidoglycan/LPS O-acetylase OafA/YrhL
LLFAVLLSWSVFPWLTEKALPEGAYLTFTQNFAMGWLNIFGANFRGAAWSLAVEEQFYLLFPLIVRYIAPKLLPYILMALIAAAPLVRIIIYHWFSKDHLLATYTFMPCRADALLIGVLCAWAVRNEYANKLIHPNPATLYGAFAVLLIGTIGLAVKAPHYYERPMVFFGLTWIALFFASVLLIAITQMRGIVSAASTISPLRYLGKIAYGVYLFHIPVVGVLHGIFLNHPPAIDSPEGFGLTILAQFAPTTIEGCS